MTDIEPPIYANPSWIEQLISAGIEFGGVDIPVPRREDMAKAAEFLECGVEATL